LCTSARLGYKRAAVLTFFFLGFEVLQFRQGDRETMSSGPDGRQSPKREGVASPEELKEFVEAAGDKLVVVDLRNPNADEEPGDVKALAIAGLPTKEARPHAVHLQWDRANHSMPLPDVESKDTPIITHCGAGGRGQLAKEFLEAHGFTNVVNGGGPKETECWKTFGHL
jgi:rhodanese-related sulfurtransferase